MAHLPTPVRVDDAVPTQAARIDQVALKTRVPRELKRALALTAMNEGAQLQTILRRALENEVARTGGAYVSALD